MHQTPTGNLLIICKKYTETGRNIRWHSNGDLCIHSGKSVIVNGKKHGIRFRKKQ